MNSKWLNGKGRCAGLGGDDSDGNGRGGGDFDDDDDKRANGHVHPQEPAWAMFPHSEQSR